jgi:hypothetical protein
LKTFLGSNLIIAFGENPFPEIFSFMEVNLKLNKCVDEQFTSKVKAIQAVKKLCKVGNSSVPIMTGKPNSRRVSSTTEKSERKTFKSKLHDQKKTHKRLDVSMTI